MIPASGRLRDLYHAPQREDPAWIEGGVLLKGSIMLAGGEAKIGKTMLLLDAADNLTTGGQLWGQYRIPEAAPTLYIDRELGPFGFRERVVNRYKERGEPPPENLHYMSRTPGLYIDTKQGLEILDREIENTGAKVVILDPISRCMVGDENSNTDVNVVFQHLNDLMAKYQDLSFILSHHFGKPPKGDDLEGHNPYSPYNFRGASKWFDAPDTLVTFRRLLGVNDEWWRLGSGWVLRHGPEPGHGLLSIGKGGLVRRVEEAEEKPRRGALKPAGGGWNR